MIDAAVLRGQLHRELVNTARDAGCPEQFAAPFAAKLLDVFEQRVGASMTARRVRKANRAKLTLAYFYQRYRRTHARAELGAAKEALAGLVAAIERTAADRYGDALADETDAARRTLGLLELSSERRLLGLKTSEDADIQ